MFNKVSSALLLVALVLLASCGGGGSSTSSAKNDTMTLTVNGVTTQYSDAQHSIIAYTSDGATKMVVSLGATNPNLNVSISFDNAPLTSATSNRTATISVIDSSGSSYGTASCTITALGTGTGGLVEGSFPDTTMTTGLATYTLSGSFSATRVN